MIKILNERKIQLIPDLLPKFISLIFCKGERTVFLNHWLAIAFISLLNPVTGLSKTHSRVLTWRIPGTAEPGGLPSVGWRRVGHE